jgi:hypothetical protein
MKLSREEKNLRVNTLRRSWSHAKWLYHIGRARARYKNIEWNLEISDIVVPKRCPVLGMKLKMNSVVPKNNSATIDRINPNIGYIKSNVAVISHLANKIKSNATVEEIKKTYQWLKKNENYNSIHKNNHRARKASNKKIK